MKGATSVLAGMNPANGFRHPFMDVSRAALRGMRVVMSELAIVGGRKALSRSISEKWERPIDREREIVGAMIDRGELTGAGSGVAKKFEEDVAAHVGCRYVLTFSHGTAALMAAYYAAGVGPGDEVITPAAGYIGSYAGALHMGARPIFCDVSAESLTIDPSCIRRAIGSRTRAVNVVHMNGRVCDLGAVMEICDEHRVALIDDASHAFGAEWDGRKLGNFSHVTCFSLQGVNPLGKPIGAGEGGLACTNDEAAYRRMLAYCHLHRTGLSAELSGSTWETMDKEVLGLKWRPHPLAMALASISLTTVDERNAKRRASYARTLECIAPFDFIRAPRCSPRAEMGGFYNGVKLVYESSRLGGVPLEVFCDALSAEGVPVLGRGIGHLEHRRRLFTERFDLWGHDRGPIRGAWQGLEAYRAPDPRELQVAEAMQASVFGLPSFIDVDEAYYDGLAEALRKLQRGYRQLASS